MRVLIMPRHQIAAADAAAEPLADTRALVHSTARVPVARVVVLAISDALLNEVTEFLEEVQLHASLIIFGIVAAIYVLRALKVVL